MANVAPASASGGHILSSEKHIFNGGVDDEKENVRLDATNGSGPSHVARDQSAREQALANGIEVYRKTSENSEPRRGQLKRNLGGAEKWVIEEKNGDSLCTISLADFCGFMQEDEDPMDVVLCVQTHAPIRAIVEEFDGIDSSPSKDRALEASGAMKRGAGPKRPLSKEKGEAAGKQKKAKSESAASGQDLTILQPYNVPQWRFTPRDPDPRGVTLSPYDRAPQLRLAEENLTVSGYKGYRLIRATHGAAEGAWYCEVKVREDHVKEVEDRWKEGKGQGAAGEKKSLEKEVKGYSRFGWARSGAYMQAPVGYDRFGYGLCGRSGHKVHMRRVQEYARPLQEGDVVGCYIYLPALPPGEREQAQAGEGEEEEEEEGAGGGGGESAEKKAEAEAPKAEGGEQGGEAERRTGDGEGVEAGGEEMEVEKDGGGGAGAVEGEEKKGGREPLLWRDTGVWYYLEEDTDTGAGAHRGSKVRFYVNGEACGEAFADIQQGTYYPAVSLYYGGQVTCNFGPDFAFPLQEEPDGVAVRAVSELAEAELAQGAAARAEGAREKEQREREQRTEGAQHGGGSGGASEGAGADPAPAT